MLFGGLWKKLAPGGGLAGSTQQISKDFCLSGCKGVLLEGLFAEVDVCGYDGAEVKVVATGTERFLQDLEIYVDEGVATIRMKKPAQRGVVYRSGGNCSVSLGRGNIVQQNGRTIIDGLVVSGSNVSIVNGVVKVDGKVVAGEPAQPASISVKVPRGLTVSVVKPGTDIRISGVRGDLYVNSDEPYDIVVDTVKRLDAFLSGTGDLQIGRIDGMATIVATGSGDVRIRGGQIDSLQLRSHGSGDVEIGATVGDGDLTATGTGSIDIKEATGRITQRCSGTGEINIG